MGLCGVPWGRNIVKGSLNRRSVLSGLDHKGNGASNSKGWVKALHRHHLEMALLVTEEIKLTNSLKL